MSLLDKIFFFNSRAKFFKSSRPEEERSDNEQRENSVGISQEQADIYNRVDYEFLSNQNSAMTQIGVSFEQLFASKHGRIQKYKEMSLYPEINDGLDKVVNDAIVEDKDGEIVKLDIVKEFPEHIQEEIRKIWDYLLNDVFAFNSRGWEMFRMWLIEAELYVELILNDEGNNIIGIKILPTHTMIPVYDENKIGGFMQTKIGNPQSQDVRQQQQSSIMFDKNQVAYVNFGLYGANKLDVRGYLESAIRVYNQIKNLEDAWVVYKLVRAPLRRIWNIAIGRMSKTKAEEYLKSLIQRYKKKIIYNADTGEIDSTANIQSLTEDFWFTRNEAGEGTNVENLETNTSLGTMDELNYFLKKLFISLKLPQSRYNDSNSIYSSGKSGEILREELQFSNFVTRLQNSFKYILINPFITLLRLRGIDERYINEDFYKVKFTSSNLFKQLKELELVESRMGVLGQISQYIYDKNTNPQGLFAKEFALRKFFMMDDKDYQDNEDMKKKQELQTKSTTPDMNAGMGGFGSPTETTPSGNEFGAASPELGTSAPTNIPTGPEAAPTPEAPIPTGPEQMELPPAESTQFNGKRSLLEHWQFDDKGIQNKYKNIKIITKKDNDNNKFINS